MSIDVIHDMSKNKRWSKTLRGLKMLLGCNAAAVRITCLGHATFLVELDGQVILTDPVRGERAYSLSLLDRPKALPSLAYFTGRPSSIRCGSPQTSITWAASISFNGEFRSCHGPKNSVRFEGRRS
jgi:hypothetical protein